MEFVHEKSPRRWKVRRFWLRLKDGVIRTLTLRNFQVLTSQGYRFTVISGVILFILGVILLLHPRETLVVGVVDLGEEIPWLGLGCVTASLHLLFGVMRFSVVLPEVEFLEPLRGKRARIFRATVVGDQVDLQFYYGYVNSDSGRRHWIGPVVKNQTVPFRTVLKARQIILTLDHTRDGVSPSCCRLRFLDGDGRSLPGVSL